MNPQDWAKLTWAEKQAYMTQPADIAPAGEPDPLEDNPNNSNGHNPAAGYSGSRPAPTDKDRFRWHLADQEHTRLPDLTRVVDDTDELLRFIWHSDEDGWQTINPAALRVRLLQTVKAADYPGSSEHASKDMFNRLLASADCQPHHRIDRHDNGYLLLRREPPHSPGRQGIRLRDGKITAVPKSALATRRLHADPELVNRMLEEGHSNPERRQWEQRLEEWLPSADLRTMLQVLVGQALVGNPAQKMMFFVGSGANGKTRLTEALRQVFGPRQEGGLACSIDSKELAPRRQSDREPRLAALEHMRLVVSSELVGQSTWNLEVLKLITGGDIMPIRELYREPRDIRPAALLLVHANQRPRLSETSTAVRRRLVVMPFDQRFTGESAVDSQVLEAEAASPHGRAVVLAWALEGLRWYQQHRRIPAAPEAAAALDDYIADHDLVGEIVRAATVEAPGERVWTNKVLKAAEDAEVEFPDWLDNRKFTRLVKQSEWATEKAGHRTYISNRQVKGTTKRLEDTPPM